MLHNGHSKGKGHSLLTRPGLLGPLSIKNMYKKATNLEHVPAKIIMLKLECGKYTPSKYNQFRYLILYGFPTVHDLIVIIQH